MFVETFGRKFKWGKLSYIGLYLVSDCHAIMAYCLETKKQTLIWHNAKLRFEG